MAYDGNVRETIAEVQRAKTLEKLEELEQDETRVTALRAIKARRSELENQQARREEPEPVAEEPAGEPVEPAPTPPAQEGEVRVEYICSGSLALHSQGLSFRRGSKKTIPYELYVDFLQDNPCFKLLR